MIRCERAGCLTIGRRVSKRWVGRPGSSLMGPSFEPSASTVFNRTVQIVPACYGFIAGAIQERMVPTMMKMIALGIARVHGIGR